MQEDLERNPGEMLRESLMKIYPRNDSTSSTTNFLEKLDRDFQGDGALASFFYESCINYLVRRLITSADHYKRTYPEQNLFEQKLKLYLRDFTNLRDRERQEIFRLLLRCINVIAIDISQGEHNRVRRTARQKNWGCYICGQSLQFSGPDRSDDHFTIDHAWPHGMGGLSRGSNLRQACRKCNNELKREFIDASDFHFEEISLVGPTEQEYIRQREQYYDTAVYLRAQCRCSMCQSPAEEVGKLSVQRKESLDAWHFLNLEAYCDRCLAKKRKRTNI